MPCDPEEAWTGGENFAALRKFPIYGYRRRLLERITQIDPGMKVFEAGSGPGHDSVLFAQNGALVTAFDQSEKALAVGRSEYSKMGYELKTIRGDLRDIQVEDDSYHLVWNAGVLEHFRPGEDLFVVREMRRIAAPGGIVLVIVPNRFYFPYQMHLRRTCDHQYRYERAFTRFSLLKLMRQVGLEDLQASGGYVHPDPSFLAPSIGWASHMLEKAFAPLERADRLDSVKSLMGLEIAVWGNKPATAVSMTSSRAAK